MHIWLNSQAMVVMSLGLYIHFPWCIQKCPYCDFNSHTLKDRLPEQAYIQRLIKEIAEIKELYSNKSPITSIFMGGGTPSLFSACGIDACLQAINQQWHIDQNAEITIEANPGSNPDFLGYKRYGVNRLSLGVQSFDDQQLKAIGRIHDSQCARDSYQKALDAGFERINIDLMFALPQQTLTQAMSDLTQAISLAPEHISWYQLTIEPNTYFYHYPPTCPPDTLSEEMYFQGKALLNAHGYQSYEVSAYTKGSQCRHNVNYWSFGDYIGIGAGAHSKWYDHGVVRRMSHKSPKHYLLSDNATHTLERIGPYDALAEYMLNRSRMPGQTTCDHIASTTGLGTDQVLTLLASPSLQPFIQISDKQIIFTDQAMLHNQSLMQEIYRLSEHAS